MDPGFQQKLEDEKELIRRAIQKELKIKEGTENLRKVTTDRKNLVHVEHMLKSSSRKLEQLHWELQELNARIVITEKPERKTGRSWVRLCGGSWSDSFSLFLRANLFWVLSQEVRITSIQERNLNLSLHTSS